MDVDRRRSSTRGGELRRSTGEKKDAGIEPGMEEQVAAADEVGKGAVQRREGGWRGAARRRKQRGRRGGEESGRPEAGVGVSWKGEQGE